MSRNQFWNVMSLQFECYTRSHSDRGATIIFFLSRIFLIGAYILSGFYYSHCFFCLRKQRERTASESCFATLNVYLRFLLLYFLDLLQTQQWIWLLIGINLKRRKGGRVKRKKILDKWASKDVTIWRTSFDLLLWHFHCFECLCSFLSIMTLSKARAILCSASPFVHFYWVNIIDNIQCVYFSSFNSLQQLLML